MTDRENAAEFFCSEIGYYIADDFELDFPDGSKARSYALQKDGEPDIFVSQGEPDSTVWQWVLTREQQLGLNGGLHHIAYRVDDCAATMKDWQERGVAEFTTEEPIIGERLIQAFTKPHPLTGIIYELIERDGEGVGFEPENVIKLMESTKGL